MAGHARRRHLGSDGRKGDLRTVTIGLLIIAVLVAIIALGPKARPAWANGQHPLTCNPTCRDNKWDWYRTSGAKCVREHEGSWRDPDPLYYGGFQANLGFHGYFAKALDAWGTADHWPRWAQIRMAKRGHAARGWYPWPNTARVCGLL